MLLLSFLLTAVEGRYMSNMIPGNQKHLTLKDRLYIERTYDDFTSLGFSAFAEMDTVHSSRDSKTVLLTFFLTTEKLFLAFILNCCPPGAVRLEKRIGTHRFLTMFEYTLMEVGVEFGKPDALETGI